ncbi:MAG: hypothetical protein ACSLFM_13730 [Tepidiformaceae bacterium]
MVMAAATGPAVTLVLFRLCLGRVLGVFAMPYGDGGRRRVLWRPVILAMARVTGIGSRRGPLTVTGVRVLRIGG